MRCRAELQRQLVISDGPGLIGQLPCFDRGDAHASLRLEAQARQARQAPHARQGPVAADLDARLVLGWQGDLFLAYEPRMRLMAFVGYSFL
jgi:hypothetical protein